MRTSAIQFQLLMEYMERYGDLSKPAEGPQGRTLNNQRWADLAAILNADATGDTKTAEKWRKVWSDFKNNSKKKAARIYRAARGTGGGPAYTIKLSDLEQRALSIMGTQAATGHLIIPEVGIEEGVSAPLPPASDTNEPLFHIQGIESFLPHMVPGREVGSVASPATWTPLQSSVPPTHFSQTPLPPARSSPILNPTPLPPTPRRRRRRQESTPIHRRTRTQTQSELARQAYVRSDCEWRAFHQETERERNRLREREIINEERWLDLMDQFLVLGNRLVNILEKK